MSSSLLLGNYVIQDQHQSTQIQNDAPIMFEFYNEREQEYIEQTSNYFPPVASASTVSAKTVQINSMPTPSPSLSLLPNQTKLKKCTCCPYGYHIDLDFIRYCEELATNCQQPSSKQLDRRNKRRQRKSLEMMLGFDEQWVLDYEKELHPSKQHKSQFQTVYEVFDILEDKVTSPYDNIDCNRIASNNERIVPIQEQHTPTEQDGDFVNNILFDVYSDFERTLERASMRSRKTTQKKSSCISRHDSYDNEKQLDVEIVHCPTRTVDRSLAAAPYASDHVHQQNVFIEEVHEQMVHQSDESLQSEAIKSVIGNDEPIAESTNIFNVNEIDKLSLANRNLGDQLQSVRNQLSDNLNRVRDFEERVKLIPKLQLELSVEKAENRDLHLKLKALQNELEKKELLEKRMAAEMARPKFDSATTTETSTSTSTLTEHIRVKPFNAHRVCATSLESLNIRFPSSASPTELKTETKVASQTKLSPSTQNVGCMTTKIVSRDVGVVTIPTRIPTRTIALNTDISAKNPFDDEKPKVIMKTVGVQSEHEAKVRTKTVATATDREASPPPSPKPIEMHSIGVLAKPNVQASSCMARPEMRSIGIDNIYQNIRTRSFGTDPIKQLVQPPSAVLSIDSPISLKLLDAPKTQATLSIETNAKSTEKPKEFRSMGVQFSPNVSNKFIQCKEQAIEPPPKAPMRTESTDTSDLTLTIHRGVNTDASPPKRDRLTNTERIEMEEKYTNTVTKAKNMTSFGTNTDFNENLTDQLSDHQCHNCLAKIEIKQRTIIKNPKAQNIDIALTQQQQQQQQQQLHQASTTTTTSTSKTTTETTSTETHNEEVFSSTQQSTDTQSRIPRPTALISPRSEKKFTRQNTYTIPNSPLSSSPHTEDVDTATAPCPAEAYLSTCGATSTQATSAVSTETHTNVSQTSTYRSRDANKIESSTSASADVNISSDSAKSRVSEAVASETTGKSTTYGNDDDEPKLWSHSMKSSSTYSHLASSRPRQKVNPSKEIQAALKVINDSLLKGQHLATTLKNANKIVQKEWFRISSTEDAQPFEVEDYLDCFEEHSPNLLKYMVNLTDANGNTAMHYAVSHGNFDVVSILLDSKMCNINTTNHAGYTCVMLVSLAKLDVTEHQTVVQRLFQIADVNVRAKKHSQTALMLATSHGNYNMVRMLLDAGADINIQDEDGSTALMCAAEHGRMDIIKILLAQPDCDSTIQDLDGSTALKISLEAGYRDIGVLLYAHEYMIKNKSPYTSLRNGGRNRKASTSLTSSTNVLHGHSSNSNIASATNATDASIVDSSKHIS